MSKTRKAIMMAFASLATVGILGAPAFANSYTNTKLPMTVVAGSQCASVKLTVDVKTPSQFDIVQHFDVANAVDPGEETYIVGLGGWHNGTTVSVTTVTTTATTAYAPSFMPDWKNGRGTITFCMNIGSATLTSVTVANIVPLP